MVRVRVGDPDPSGAAVSSTHALLCSCLQEMAAVAAFLQTGAPRPYPTHYMDTAIQTYRDTCKYGQLFSCSTNSHPSVQPVEAS